MISLPGSKDQRLHKDHPALFPETEWSYTLPVFATQIIIQLVLLDEFTTTTRFCKGTHKCSIDKFEEDGTPGSEGAAGGLPAHQRRGLRRGKGCLTT